MYDTSLWLGGKEFKSRLIVGTGKYPSSRTCGRPSRPPARRWSRWRCAAWTCRGRASRCSTTSTPNRYTCCRTPPAATPPTTRCARPWRGRPGSATWSSSRSSATSGRCSPTRRAARGGAHPGQGGLHRPALHQRRPRARQAARGRGRGGGDAARRADRLRARHPQPAQHPAHPGGGEGAGHRRRRRRHGVRRRHRHGARLRRRADEHGHRRRRRIRWRWPPR